MFANVMTFLVALMLFGKTLYHTLRRLCKGQHAPVGRENSVVYSKVNQIEAYVPEVSARVCERHTRRGRERGRTK